MIIHVVSSGDSIYSIAQRYNVTPESIIQANELRDPSRLAVGQALVILMPDEIYTVQPGDTLVSIARRYGVTVEALLRSNPWLSDNPILEAGQQINISYGTPPLGEIDINGYAYPYIAPEVLRKTLPFLTFITLFTYGFQPDGTLIPLEGDEAVINTARGYGTAPLMLISTLGEDGKFSNALAHAVLNDMDAQNRLITEILVTLQEKNYAGLDVDFEYVLPQDREAYVDFIRNLRSRLAPEGYTVFVALAPKTSDTQPGLLYEAHDYRALGEAADAVLLMTYEWGYAFGPPMAVAPLNKVREVLDYAVTRIPREKIFMGMPNYGYNWTLPFTQGSQAQSLSNVAAVELAIAQNAAIEFDETAQSPFFTYYDSERRQHIVWFEDARSVMAKARLADEYGLRGVSIWNIMRYFPQNWLVLNALFSIRKL